jgi:hypothetical protein
MTGLYQEEVWQVALPSRLRRLILVMLASFLGGGCAYAAPSLFHRGKGVLLIVPLALLAGTTGLWSA